MANKSLTLDELGDEIIIIWDKFFDEEVKERYEAMEPKEKKEFEQEILSTFMIG